MIAMIFEGLIGIGIAAVVAIEAVGFVLAMAVVLQ